MADRQPTVALGRRYTAFLLDAVLTALPGLAVALARAETFDITERGADDQPVFDDATNARLAELADVEIGGVSEVFGIELARSQEVGDTLWVFGQDAVTGGLLAWVLAAVVGFAIVPALLGRTLGMVPFGLRIIDREWNRAPVVAHVVRSLVGVIDALPLIVPGALGFLIAGRSPEGQRLGDRVAGTFVVGRAARPPRSGASATDTLVAAIEDGRGDIDGDLESPVDEAVTVNEAAAESGAATTTGRDVFAEEWQVEPTHAEDRFERPPPPMHRQPIVDALTPTSGPPPATADEPSEPSERAGMEPPEREPADDAAPGDEILPTLAEQPADDDRPGADESVPWDPPIAEPAPVWTPPPDDEPAAPAPAADLLSDPFAFDPPAEPEPAEPAEPVEAESAEPEPGVGDGVTLRPEPGVSDGDANEGDDDEEPADAVERDDAVEGDDAAERDDHADQADDDADDDGLDVARSADGPVWSEKWRAWLYWDPKSQRWLRHDESIDTWIPIS